MAPSPTSKSDLKQHPLGELLVTERVISEAQLRAALAYQKQHPNQRLGQILTAQLGTSQESLNQALRWQQQLRTTVLVLSILAIPWRTAWGDAVGEHQTQRFNWASSCQSNLCLSQDSTMSKIPPTPALTLEIQPKAGSNILDLIGHGYELKLGEGSTDSDIGQSYRVSISPKAVSFGWQFKF